MEQRRFVLRHLREFGFGKRTMAELVQEEAVQLVEDFKEKIMNSKDGKGEIMEMRDAFSVGVLNTLWSMMASKRYNAEDKELKDLQALLTELFANIDMVGALFSQFPFLRYIAPEASGYTTFVNIHQQVWKFLRAELDNHKDTFILNQPRDLMDVYLQMLHSQDKKESYSGKYYKFSLCNINYYTYYNKSSRCIDGSRRITAFSDLHGHVHGWIRDY